jgi:hypothetical protein
MTLAPKQPVDAAQHGLDRMTGGTGDRCEV